MDTMPTRIASRSVSQEITLLNRIHKRKKNSAFQSLKTILVNAMRNILSGHKLIWVSTELDGTSHKPNS